MPKAIIETIEPVARRTRVRCRRRRGRGGKASSRGSASWWDFAPHPTDANGADLEASEAEGFPVVLPSGQGVFLLPSAANPQCAATFLPEKEFKKPTTVECAEARVEADDSLSSGALTDEESADDSVSSSASAVSSLASKSFEATVGARAVEDLWDSDPEGAGSDCDDWSACSGLTSLSATSVDSLSCATSLASPVASWASFHDCLSRPSVPGLGALAASVFELDPLPELAAKDEAFDAYTLSQLARTVDALTADGALEADEHAPVVDALRADTYGLCLERAASKREERRRCKAEEADAKALAEKEARRFSHEKRERRNLAKAERRQLKSFEARQDDFEVEAALRALGL